MHPACSFPLPDASFHAVNIIYAHIFRILSKFSTRGVHRRSLVKRRGGGAVTDSECTEYHCLEVTTENQNAPNNRNAFGLMNSEVLY